MEKRHDLGQKFEPLALKTILNGGGETMKRFRRVLTPDLFHVDQHRVIAGLAFDYFDRHGEAPSRRVLEDLVRRSDFRDKALAIKTLVELDAVESEPKYVADRLLDWAKWTAIDDVLAAPSEDPTALAAEIAKAAALGDEVVMKCVKMSDPSSGEAEVEGRHVPAPWPWLNARLRGGPCVQDLAVVLTVVNGGKTTILVNIARAAMQCGELVVYFTFEDGETKIRRRLMQCITAVSVEELSEDVQGIQANVESFLSRFGGDCYIKDAVSRRTKVGDAASFVQAVEAATNRKVGLVITDYADRFRPPTKREEPRHELREVYEECKALARSLNVVHWTASQVNKMQMGRDRVDMDSVSEAYGKMESPDLVLGFGQTTQDEAVGQMLMFTAKVRDAQRHESCVLNADFSKQVIWEPD